MKNVCQTIFARLLFIILIAAGSIAMPALAAEESIELVKVFDNTVELTLHELPLDSQSSGILIVTVYAKDGMQMLSCAVREIFAKDENVSLSFAGAPPENAVFKAFLLDGKNYRPLIPAARLNREKPVGPVLNKLNVSFNGYTYTATLAKNSSAEAFVALLREKGGSIVIEAHDYGGFEKVGPLGGRIVSNNEQINTVPGDIILYQGGNVCLYYAENSWNFTRLGRLDGDLSSLRARLGSGNVAITYALSSN